MSKLVARSRFFIVKRSVKTAWEREELLLKHQLMHEILDQTNVRFVHVRSCDRTCLISLVHKGHHFVLAAHGKLAKILDIGSQTWMLANPQITRILGVKQVANLLVVDLNVRHFNGEIEG